MEFHSTRNQDRSITAVGLAYGRPSRSYRSDRECSVRGCATHLSRYNPTSRCALHDHLH
jgi:hypothetical protein